MNSAHAEQVSAAMRVAFVQSTWHEGDRRPLP